MIYDKVLLDAITSSMNADDSRWVLTLKDFKDVHDCTNETIKHMGNICPVTPTKWSITAEEDFSEAYKRTIIEEYYLNAINFNDIERVADRTLTDYSNFILCKESVTDTEIKLMRTFDMIKIDVRFDITTTFKRLGMLPLPWMKILFYDSQFGHIEVVTHVIDIKATESDVPSTRMTINISMTNSDRKQLLEKYAAEVKDDIAKKIDRKFFKSVFKIF